MPIWTVVYGTGYPFETKAQHYSGGFLFSFAKAR